MNKKWAGRVTVVGVAWSGDEASMQAFIDRHGITFQSMNDQTGALFAHFGVPAQPAWVFVSPDGTAKTYLGAMEPDVLDTALSNTMGGR
ncbi:unannotated protein [freshwater metagenome]|uniref:Unannotated protein n=1 Tax=freshwater metagenome TaxID=449393 RepID=A0A6J7FNT9_9ZZZZ|nr:redoxin domain-containing protein [Actinomycetota bacterium]